MSRRISDQEYDEQPELLEKNHQFMKKKDFFRFFYNQNQNHPR
jgi:hypothetical protein